MGRGFISKQYVNMEIVITKEVLTSLLGGVMYF